jgi:beta-lactamase regulating signal transducer with metallopeptidase domain
MIPALSLSPALAFALEAAAKATLVLLAAGAASAAVSLRGGSAAARHLVWTLGVCGALALPVLSAVLPGWRTPLLTIAAPRAEAPAASAAPAAFAPTADGPVASLAPADGAPRTAASATGAVESASTEVASVAQASTGDAGMGIGLGAAAVALYLAGVLAVIGRLAIGRWSVGRLARRAASAGEPAWAAQVRDVAWEMDVRRPVRVLRSPEATMPMTWGILHPTVLLPAEADAWPEERRRVVLLHELAHVARHDCLTQTLAAAACALYWFNPAAWLAARRLRVERELACDDRVLTAGTRARDYATHLLEVARAFRPARLAGPVAVSMARPSQLEGRLLAVLDSVRNRGMMTRASAVGAAVLALAVVLPLAAIRPAQAQDAPAGVTFHDGPRPWNDTTKVKPPRSRDAYPDLDAAMRAGVQDYSIPARQGERLTLRLPAGVSARVEAWDRPSVHVRVDDRELRVNAARGEGGPHVTVTGRPAADTGTEPHVRIQAPRDFDVDAQADGGGLEIGALNGTFTGTVREGGIAFVGSRGTVRMTARGGGAYISRTHLDGRLVMDGGGALVDRNTGNLDVSGAAAIASGRPGGQMRVDVPGNARSGQGEEIACSGDACTITTAQGGRAARTTVATGQGGRVTATTAQGRGVTVVSGQAVAGAPARTATVSGTTQSAAAAPVRITGSGQTVTVAPSRTTGSGQTITIAPSRVAASGQTVTVAPSRTTGSGQTITIAPSRVAASGQAVTVAPSRVRGSGQGVTIAPSRVERARGADVYLDGTVVSVDDQQPGTVTVTSADGQATTVTTRDGGTIRGQARSGGASTTVARDDQGYAYSTGDVPGRIAAIRQMARNAPPEAAAQGIGRLTFGDEDVRVQRAGVDELERMGTRTAREQLRRISRDHPSREIRARAAEALR